MSKKVQGLENGLTNYGDKGFARYLRRSFAKSMGYTDASLDKPIVGICYTESGFNNCHRHFPEMLEAIKRGVLASGALPVPFPIMSLGEVFLSPTSMVYRNLMAMAVEEMITAQPMDSVVLMGGCDKTVPALLMGAASAGKPATMVVAGPMMTGRHKGERLGACTDCRRFWAQYRAGTVDEPEINQIEGRLATTAGTCAVMGTASSMAAIAETLGMILPGSAGIPAVHADRLRNSEETGVVAAKMALSENALTPDKIMTREAVENALRVLLAVSGSTNAIIHLTAIAGRLGIDISLDRMNQLSDETPVVVDLKPVGQGYMEDFHSAGGLDGVLDAIKDKVHRSPINIEGVSLGDRLDTPKADPFDHNVIRTADNPVDPQGGLIALSGSLAPEGAILKRAAATPELLEHEGRAVVFTSLEDLANRIDDPDLDINADDVMILQNAGPRSPSGMPEAGYLPIPKKLARAGVKDMVRISDARMSGTAFGTIVLHVTPEADLGGPLALVQNGDRIRLSAKAKSISLLVSEEELERRRAAFTSPNPEPARGYKQLYHNTVLPATKGCDFDFLQKV
ncbi:dihydroxy-acid dehydratase [Pseudovibrio sp. Ad14]|uniref:dihydroxy-acid dehydratase n=1 Tax=Pseudovibrio sp. Ad14 TaxID=989397 RepID=UPI0007AE4E2C|nr:dihydroxy-acid dehydratase [Pseudovibrio sp. Ad14]KZL09163.1 L-arabonate dehydratase [Pseudovibrio sp. Ad14]